MVGKQSKIKMLKLHKSFLIIVKHKCTIVRTKIFQKGSYLLGVLYTYLLAGSSTKLQPATDVNGLPVRKLEGGEGSSQDREAIVP